MDKKRVRVPVTDPVERRVEMINGMFDLPQETRQAMAAVRESAEAFARALRAIYTTPGIQVDTGRAIASIDTIQSIKNVACDALILPHATKEVEEQ